MRDGGCLGKFYRTFTLELWWLQMDVLNQIPFNLHRVLTKYIKEELLWAVSWFGILKSAQGWSRPHLVWKRRATQKRLIEAVLGRKRSVEKVSDTESTSSFYMAEQYKRNSKFYKKRAPEDVRDRSQDRQFKFKTFLWADLVVQITLCLTLFHILCDFDG